MTGKSFFSNHEYEKVQFNFFISDADMGVSSSQIRLAATGGQFKDSCDTIADLLDLSIPVQISYNKEDYLLAKAKRDYPIGTRVTHSGRGLTTQGFYYDSNRDRVLNGDGYMVYSKGHWARIITKEEVPEYTVEELINKVGHEFKIKK
jgi:hypothetical protein